MDSLFDIVPAEAPAPRDGRGADPALRLALGGLVAAISPTLARDRATRQRAARPTEGRPFEASVFTTTFTGAARAGWPADEVLVALSMSPAGPGRDEIFVALPDGRVARLRLEPGPGLVAVLKDARAVPDAEVRSRMADAAARRRAPGDAAGARVGPRTGTAKREGDSTRPQEASP